MSLFFKSMAKNVVIGDMGRWDDNKWVREFNLIDFLSTSEVTTETNLILLLVDVRLSLKRKDMRKWMSKKSRLFAINLKYCFLQSQTILEGVDDYTLQSILKLWKNEVPSKLSIFFPDKRDFG